MDTWDLECFLAVADELHFGQAARKLHIAEQPLGYRVRKLEDELGFKLFDRTTRSVRLTPAGSSFEGNARRIVAQQQQAVESARLIAGGKAGVVRLGYESATVVSILPDFVRLFRTEYPEISLRLVEHNKDGLHPLASGDTDACLITRYSNLPKGFEYLPILEDRAVIALPKEHRLASRKELSLADLDEVPFLGYAGANGESPNRFMEKLVTHAGTDSSISHEAETYTALLGLVSAELGFTIVTTSMARLFPDEVSYVPLSDPEVSVDYGLTLREGDSSAILKSIRIVARHLARIL